MADLPPAALPPHDRPRRAWVRPVVIIAVVVLAAIAAWYFWGASSGDAAKTKAADAVKDGKGAKGGFGKGGKGGGVDPNRAQPVSVATARVGDLSIVQTALGTATSLRTVTVKPRVDGQLASVAFTEGQIVKAGDTIAQIDPVPFQVALSQAEGQLARDAAQLNNARLDLDRYRTLLTQDSIAAQQVDQQAALVKQLEGTVKIDQAMVDNAKLQLSYTHIIAPIPGRIGLRQVDPGNMVRGADTNGVAVITQIDPITVVFTIPQDTLPRILKRLNTGDKPAVEAWDREQKVMLARGALLTTDNQIDVTTGTVKLKAQFPNTTGALFPNQFVNVRMVVEVLHNVVIVPSAAIQRATQGTIVYVVGGDSSVAVRPITLGPSEGENTSIASGLQAGERVITDGVDRIREGAKVEVTDPSAAPAPGPRQRAGKGGAGKGSDGKSSDGKGADGKGTDGKGADATPEQREAFKKRLEAMTPEQRDELRKRREARQGGGEGQAGKAPQ
jgi:multidrug efflux system membrane fusion protein